MKYMRCNCFKCPYGIEDYERYIDIFDDLKEEVDYEYIAQYIYCDKTGGKCWGYGHCDEAFECENVYKYNNKKSKRNKKQRLEKHLSRLKFLEAISNYPPPVIYVDKKWDKELRRYISVDKPYYKRCYRNNHKGGRHTFYKKYANRIVRNYGIGIVDIDEDIDDIFPYNKSHGQLKKGSNYKKVFDYWWTVD
jgi:hypothetical protein